MGAAGCEDRQEGSTGSSCRLPPGTHKREVGQVYNSHCGGKERATEDSKDCHAERSSQMRLENCADIC